MKKRDRAFITFYDAAVETVTFCAVLKDGAQGAIDRAVQHDVEPASPDEPITDAHARLLGSMTFLQLAAAYPALQSRLQITAKGSARWKPNGDPAAITFYDEATQTVKVCTVSRDEVQVAIERAMKHDLGLESPDAPITNEHARLLGGMAFLILASGYPELRPRLQITTKRPVNWTPALHPDAL